MNCRLSSLALLVLLTLGTGVSQAQVYDQGLAKSIPPHTVSYVEWTYFGGRGFASGTENYAFSGAEQFPTTHPVASDAPAGHHYTTVEYLYFSGRGFSSATQ